MSPRALLLPVLALALGCSPPASRLTGKIELLGADSAEGVVVRLLDDEQASAITGPSGQFELEARALPVSLFVAAEGVSPRTQTIRITDPGEPLVIRFTAVGTLAGTASRGGAATGNAGIAVSIVGAAPQTQTTDPGAWSLEVPAGVQLVRATAPGYGVALSAPVTVKRGARVEVEPLLLPLAGFGFTGALVGKVARVGSSSHEGVRVLVEGAGRTTLSGPGGEFELTGVPEGSYTLVLEDDGLIERVPNVIVTRGADGFIVDRNLYRLGDRPIVLMRATRLQSTSARLSRVRPPFAAWLATDPEYGIQVRWAEASNYVAREAGKVARYAYDTIAPGFSADGRWLVWSSNDGNLHATSTAAGATRLLATGFRRGTHYDGSRYVAPISAGGLVAFEGFLPQTNFSALRVVSLAGAAPQVAHHWQDSSSHVYAARFHGEALVSVTDVSEYAGSLRWWKGSEPERTISSSISASSFNYYSSAQRFIQINDYWGQSHQLVDLEQGAVVHSQASRDGVFSADWKSYAWNTPSSTQVVELPSLTETKALDKPESQPLCVVGRTVVSSRYSAAGAGELIAATNGTVVSLAPAVAGRQRQVTRCAGGRVYWAEYPPSNYAQGGLHEAPLTGGPPVELATGAVATYALDVRDGNVWYATGSRTINNLSYGTLWITRQGGGTARKIAEDVRLSMRMLEPSPDQKRLALIARDGLYVVGADGTGLRRIATGVDEVTWLSDDQLVFTIPVPPPPFSFQGGVYFARL